MRPQVAALAAGLVVVAVVHLVPVRIAMERHLTADSRAALDRAGLTGVDVSVTGLEARLTGSVADGSEVDRALDAVVAVDGVASARSLLDQEETELADAPSSAAAPPQTSVSPESTPPAPVAPESAPTASAPTGQAPATPAPSSPAGAPAAGPEVDEALARASDALAAIPTITFLQNSVVLTPEGEQAVAQVAEVITAAPPTLEFVVEAHSDLAGPDDFNKQLSIRRAATVRSALIGSGVSRTRVMSVGRGESSPLVVPEITEEDRLTNRRVEILVQVMGTPATTGG